ncbi:MAG: permease-like cell division protein FtsX [Clostridia bacterium]|nr:permease-like cell division protein FtsX [Clostridia bacterium]
MRGTGYLFKEGIRSVWNNRLMSAASIGVLVSCLLITGMAILMSLNVRNVVDQMGKDNQITVFLETNIDELTAVQVIGPEIRRLDNISACEFYSKDEGIVKWEKELGPLFGELQGAENPLPHAFHVTMVDLSQYQTTVDSIMQVEGVDLITDRSEVAKRLTDLNTLVTQVGLWLVAALGIISLFIISNSVRMTMYSRRFEISIMKSVGATNHFVRTPFVIEGVVLGLISGVLASVIVAFLYETMISAVKYIVPINEIPYSELAFNISAGFIVFGMIIGAIGALISIGRYLNMEGGEILGW